MEEMTGVFGKESFQIKAKPGSGCFFTQENIHGSGRPNITGKTRVSMDFRIAEGIYGDYLGRKIPAGYFHLIPDTDEEEEMLAKQAPKAASFANGKSNIFYVANNTASTYGIPVHLQRYMLVDYCNKKNLKFDYELFDLEDMIYLPTLRHLVEDRECNIVMYSICGLPWKEDAFRNELLETAVKRGSVIHFVNEDLQLTSADDLKTVKK